MAGGTGSESPRLAVRFSGMERLVFMLVSSGFAALTRLRDAPYQRRNPGYFRVYWQPSWLTRWERRLKRQPGHKPPGALPH